MQPSLLPSERLTPAPTSPRGESGPLCYFAWRLFDTSLPLPAHPERFQRRFDKSLFDKKTQEWLPLRRSLVLRISATTLGPALDPSPFPCLRSRRRPGRIGP